MKNQDFGIIRDYSALEKIIEGLKAAGKTIVLTNGAFDMFHIGHLRYLKKAKEFGDYLIIGIDSDELDRAIKGPNRPIALIDERLEIIEAIREVDIVTINELPEKEEGVIKGAKKLINLVKPDVLIISESTKDPDRLANEMKEYGGVCQKIEMLPPQATTSTTARIRRFVIEGTEGFTSKISAVTKKHREELDKVISDHMNEMKGGA